MSKNLPAAVDMARHIMYNNSKILWSVANKAATSTALKQQGGIAVGFWRNLCNAARPLADELPPEPLIHLRHVAVNEPCVMAMESVSTHPVWQAQLLHWSNAAQIIDHLRRDGITVFQLAFLPHDLSIRMLDFLCGAALIHRAGLYRIAAQTYLLTPQGVTVDETLLRQLERNGLYTRDSQIRRQRLA